MKISEGYTFEKLDDDTYKVMKGEKTAFLISKTLYEKEDAEIVCDKLRVNEEGKCMKFDVNGRGSYFLELRGEIKITGKKNNEIVKIGCLDGRLYDCELKLVNSTSLLTERLVLENIEDCKINLCDENNKRFIMQGCNWLWAECSGKEIFLKEVSDERPRSYPIGFWGVDSVEIEIMAILENRLPVNIRANNINLFLMDIKAGSKSDLNINGDLRIGEKMGLDCGVLGLGSDEKSEHIFEFKGSLKSNHTVNLHLDKKVDVECDLELTDRDAVKQSALKDCIIKGSGSISAEEITISESKADFGATSPAFKDELEIKDSEVSFDEIKSVETLRINRIKGSGIKIDSGERLTLDGGGRIDDCFFTNFKDCHVYVGKSGFIENSSFDGTHKASLISSTMSGCEIKNSHLILKKCDARNSVFENQVNINGGRFEKTIIDNSTINESILNSVGMCENSDIHSSEISKVGIISGLAVRDKNITNGDKLEQITKLSANENNEIKTSNKENIMEDIEL